MVVFMDQQTSSIPSIQESIIQETTTQEQPVTQETKTQEQPLTQETNTLSEPVTTPSEPTQPTQPTPSMPPKSFSEKLVTDLAQALVQLADSSKLAKIMEIIPLEQKNEYMRMALNTVASMQKPKDILEKVASFAKEHDIDIPQLLKDNIELASAIVVDHKVDPKKLEAVVEDNVEAVMKSPCFSGLFMLCASFLSAKTAKNKPT